MDPFWSRKTQHATDLDILDRTNLNSLQAGSADQRADKIILVTNDFSCVPLVGKQPRKVAWFLLWVWAGPLSTQALTQVFLCTSVSAYYRHKLPVAVRVCFGGRTRDGRCCLRMCGVGMTMWSVCSSVGVEWFVWPVKVSVLMFVPSFRYVLFFFFF